MSLGDEGKSTNVVVVGVGEYDRIQIVRNLIEKWGGVPTVTARVHSRIEHNRRFSFLD